MKKQIICLVASVALFCSSGSLMANANRTAVSSSSQRPSSNAGMRFMSNHPYPVACAAAMIASVAVYNLNADAKREFHELKAKLSEKCRFAQQKVAAKMRAFHRYCTSKE